MRIALVDPSLFTLPYDAALARALTAAGHHATLYARRPRAGEAAAPDIDLCALFYKLSESPAVSRLPKPFRLGIKGADHIAGMLALLRRCRAQPPDVVHFQWLPLPLIDARFLGAFARIAPLVLTVHDTDPFNGSPSAGLQTLGFTHALPAFGRIIVHTRQGRDRLAARGIDSARIAIVPHGPLALPPTVPVTDKMDGALTLTLFGKIKPYKGADILLRAYAALPESLRLQATVRIIGQSYMDLAPLAALAGALGIAHRVAIEDRFIDDSDVPAIFALGTIAVFPYREIEASGVLSLALAHGRPIVASRLGNFAETLQDGTHGRLVPPNDVAALTEALAGMIADRNFAAACAANVVALAGQAPGWSDIARQTVRIYEAAARDCQPAPRLAELPGHAP